MSNYQRLISYIYTYEGGIKGRNIGFAKLETRGQQCKIAVNVKRIFVGGNPLGVYLLSNQGEVQIGLLFARNSAGEFRTTVNSANVEGSDQGIEEFYGLSIHDVESAWRAYTTIWEDAVAHAAEIELADVTAEKLLKKQEEKEKLIPEIITVLPISKEIEAEIEREAKEQPKKIILEQEIKEPLKELPVSMLHKEELAEEEKKLEDDLEIEEKLETEEKPEVHRRERWRREGMSVRESLMEISNQESPVETLSQESIRTEMQIQEPVRAGGLGQESARAGVVTQESSRAGVPIQQTLYEEITNQVSPHQEALQLNTAHLKKENMETSLQETISRETSGLEMPQPPVYAQSAPLTPQEACLVNTTPHTPGVEALQPPVSKNMMKEMEDTNIYPPVVEDENETRDQCAMWDLLRKKCTKILAFDYADGCEILTIKPQDIGLLPRDNWVYGNNSFLLHGYYNFRHLILARLENPVGRPRYLLGIPGNYYSNEKYMASMFGFPDFVLSKSQSSQDGRFGYWYADIKIGD